MEDGFKKIKLEKPDFKEDDSLRNSKNEPIVSLSNNRKTDMKNRNKILRILTGLVLIFILIFSVLFFQAKNLYQKIRETIYLTNKVWLAAKNQDLEELKTGLFQLKGQLAETKKTYSFFAFARFIPIVKAYYQDGESLFNAGEAGIEAAQISVDSLIPYADLLGFKGQSSFVAGSADERIQTAVATFDKLTPKLGDISAKVEIIKNSFDKIDVNRYPVKVGDREVRSRLSSLRETIEDITTLFINARPLLENLPQLLGQPKIKRYLVLFQNDKELRPTGGFITAYALFKVEKGKLIVESSDDIYNLDEKNPTKISPPVQFINHLKVYQLHLRDTNCDPDFKDSMRRFEEIYNKIPGTTQVDGIIALDTHVLVEAMKILGPIPAYGTNFVVDNDPRCDCPKVIYDLEEYAGRRVGYIREERKDIIGVLLYQIMQKALGVSPSQYWGRLFRMILSELEQKHVLIYLHDESSQRSLEALNFVGRMQEVSGVDYLHINDANLGGAKSNMFVKHYIKQEYEKADDGSIIKILTIDYKNPKEGSKGCNLEAGGLCLNGLMPNWVRIYVPKGAELLDFQGSEDPPKVGEAYNRTFFEGFITVRPNSVTTIKIKYRLPGDIIKDNKTILSYIQKQAGTEGHELITKVNGKEVSLINLTTDKKLEINF